MTGDLSENETESRLSIPYLCKGRAFDQDEFMLEDMRCSYGKDGQGADRSQQDLVRNDGYEARSSGGSDTGNDESRGSGDFNTGSNDGSDSLPLANGHACDAADNCMRDVRGKLNRQALSRDLDSSADERDEETEDDYEESDGQISLKSEKQQQHQLHHHHDQEQIVRKAHQNQQQKAEQEQPTPQPLGGGWESFLSQKNLKVLLAEDDDCTRHVVGALLRNCCYEVTSVANGMQAWDMLEDPNNHFDLLLTDVVMPCLSGVGLLTKIMGTEACKRIPVIMMSSHDSLDIVFRCLSKGAADFLVKPVRKNELKNLWQHVWRRCHSSSGSGSGSGSGTGKVTKPESKVGSGNDSGSNDGSDDGSSGLNVRGGSDNGSGTQAVVNLQTWEKIPRDQEDAEEGQATSVQKCSDEQMGQDLEMATRRPATVELEKSTEEGRHDEPSAVCGGEDRMDVNYNSPVGANSGGTSRKAIDLIGGIACQSKDYVEDGQESSGDDEGSDRGASNSPTINDGSVPSSQSLPLLELSLKRPRAPGEDDNDGDERRVLRQSGGSAFSRYNTGATVPHQHQIPCGSPLSLNGYSIAGGYVGSTLSTRGAALVAGKSGHLRLSTPLDRAGSSKGSGEASTSPLHPHISHLRSGQDLSSPVPVPSGQDLFRNSRPVKDETVSPLSASGMHISIPLPPPGLATYDGVSAAYGSGMHPVFYSQPGAPPWASGPAHMADRGEVFDHPPYHEHGSHFSHHHNHRHQHHLNHHCHHHPHLLQGQIISQQDEQTVTNPGSGAPCCGSSNIAGTLADGTTVQSGSSNNYGSIGNGGSVNGSASGSNGNNGQSCIAGAAGTNRDSGNNNGHSANGTGTGPGNGVVGAEHNRFAHREAALNKFRQKRKERCFEKKVRYQSRKRLAEQRPRIRGQFVRQAVYEHSPAGDAGD